MRRLGAINAHGQINLCWWSLHFATCYCWLIMNEETNPFYHYLRHLLVHRLSSRWKPQSTCKQMTGKGRKAIFGDFIPPEKNIVHYTKKTGIHFPIKAFKRKLYRFTENNFFLFIFPLLMLILFLFWCFLYVSLLFPGNEYWIRKQTRFT